MKLLAKSEVTKAKAIERHQEIEEGKKLANRVDTLRQLSATEEKNLMNFRAISLSKIQKEIEARFEIRDSIDHEIKARKAELAVLMLPIDAKWHDIEKAQKILDDWEEELDEKALSNKQEKEQNLNFQRELNKRQENLEHNESVFKQMLAEAARMMLEGKEVLADARNQAQVYKTQEELSILDLKRREDAVAFKEEASERISEENARVRNENELEKIRLADMRATLERGFKELKSKSS